MRLGQRLAGLAARLRPPTAIDATFVLDHAVAGSYPGAVTGRFPLVRWVDGQLADSDLLSIIPVDGAIVTYPYLPIDPARRIAFLNHSYDNAPRPPGVPRPKAGDATRRRGGRIVELRGRVVVIGGVLAGNYYHGLLNWFTRLTLVEMLAPAVHRDPEVRFLIDEEARAEPFLSILKAMAVPLDRVVWGDARTDHRIEHALLPSFVHEGLLCRPIFEAQAARIRETLGIAPPSVRTRRIWISREHMSPPRRRIANFDGIAPILDAHGFERVVLERLSFAEQVRLFYEADVVAGSHGAGFSNLTFAAPGARVLIVEKDFSRFVGIANLFSGLAHLMGHRCEIVPATSVRTADVDYSVFVNAHFADAHVEPADFAEGLERLLAG